MKSPALLLLASLATLGCGSAPPTCKIEGFLFVVGPKDSSATPDHTSPAPGNQQQFNAGLGSTYGPNCISNHLYRLTHAQWTTGDPANATISSADDATNGTATCLGATSTTVSATLTSSGFTETRTTSLTCK